MRFGPARQSTARRGGERLEIYYVNVFFIEELQLGPALPDHVAILPINFHSAEHFAGLSAVAEEKKGADAGEESVFHSTLSGMQIVSLTPSSLLSRRIFFGVTWSFLSNF